ncbi:hypothetical protein [Plebeiibacterium sediminum]|uniref:J domain-containing protein n=1 Tax=Plebeiibacterium sediminum TaxID=2992112 RepID=A0AAE3M7L9_9BACT|nr:hypothetical protein [Plebeiobacterium sediminum]MCW3788497.1 hypothetical protein [Plebeiobacterium sediminum]
MKYFLDITDIEEAKARYRKLAKQLHPDAGGIANEFQNMQNEYHSLLQKLQQNNYSSTLPQNVSPENELIKELGKYARTLIKKQVPQNYLRKKIEATDSTIKKSLFEDLVSLLDSIK